MLPSILDRSATVAPAGYRRWLVPPAALAVHMCIGQVYGFSVFNKPLARELYGAEGAAEVAQVNLAYFIALVLLGLSAAVLGKWVERNGPRKTMLAACCCFCGGLVLASLAAKIQSPILLWAGYGILGGIGLGLGYISPVSTLIKWFPDRPGMATGLAIMGFGSGALIGAPLGQGLMKHFATATSSGAAPALLVMAGLYAVFMIFGACIVRVPAEGWKPEGWTPPAHAAAASPVLQSPGVAVDRAWKTPQFWLLWVVLCMNVSAGIGILGKASDILQTMFAASPEMGTGFVGLLSIFNLGGRFVWSTCSDYLGRKVTYCIYFILGIALYLLLPWTQETQSRGWFLIFTSILLSMYGGGFATIPAYLRDMFGSYQVGAIHGRLITAWSVASVLGYFLINGLYVARTKAGVPPLEAYNGIFQLMAGLLAIGLVANLLVKPVAKHHFEPAKA